MKNHGSIRTTGPLTAIALVALHHLFSPPEAAAYVDPMSGSIVLQVLAAAVLGGIVGIRRSWDSISAMVKRVTRRSPE